MKRASGILLPVSSLPSPYGIGMFSKSAYDFVDFLVEAGQTYWQILPLGPTSYGDSPYQSFSTFAGNPYFIDLEALIEEGVLTKAECRKADCGQEPRYVDYGQLYDKRLALLRKAYERSEIGKDADFLKFVDENQSWLKDYALFMAVKKCFDGASWLEWAEDIRLRWGNALDYYYREYAEEIEFYEYLQYKFMQHWKKLKKYANEQGIRIIGDIPIYVALDSADVWAHPGLFQMDETGKPKAVAGCPPDAFSETGQLWGNPLYRWDVHKNQDYDWWTRRMKHCYELYDVVRIDHFRGFDEYFSIPYGAKDATDGKWEKGPGMDLFRTLERKLGKKDVIAEDLGLMTDSVRKLVKESGYPNMKVLGFAFDVDGLSDHLPHNYDKNCVVYTGTHDNETLMQWYDGLKGKELAFVQDYMNNKRTPHEEVRWDFIRLAMLSVADTCIIPIQDYLGFGKEARMNFPSTLGENWKWRLKKGDITKALTKEIYHITKLSCRL
ncbi:MAG: 4-alpha-glucanotransferase [Marvinbryantia sp.]|uniref:4-alpha-glucanotransferase n=1 Tax=Marvinbryantia sp. TaxID=2496532 RepID=UPI0025E1F5E2|nr:4-alpha-glucanotransferase [uncultured Marvinbryantia sp.]